MLQTLSPATIVTTNISRECVVAMVQNYIDNTYKRTPEGPRKINNSDDAYCIYFKKEELDNLFERNGYDPANPNAKAYGLVIYLGMHGQTEPEKREMPHCPPRYQGHHTAILVCTLNRKEFLRDGDTVATATEEGQLCPPPKPCASIDEDLHP
jgi:hypothetical protein